MGICRYEAKFVEMAKLEPEEQEQLMNRSSFGPPVGEDLSKLVAYIELEAESGTRPGEWLVCPFCMEPARIVRILPFIAVHPLLWPTCEKCYGKRNSLEKAIPLPGR